jgi:hypothetical protein
MFLTLVSSSDDTVVEVSGTVIAGDADEGSAHSGRLTGVSGTALPDSYLNARKADKRYLGSVLSLTPEHQDQDPRRKIIPVLDVTPACYPGLIDSCGGFICPPHVSSNF